MQLVVFKVGGSLLDLPNLGGVLEELIALRPDAAPLLVLGGGATADLVRRWDRIHDLGETRAHWLAVRSLGLNEAFLRELLPHCRSVSSRTEVIAHSRDRRIALLDTLRFLELDEQQADSLPHCWDVTSDSIAAHVAIRFEATELVLVKSVPLIGTPTLHVAQKSGLVDRHFSELAGRIPRISWVNLRDNNLTPIRILPWLNAGEPLVTDLAE